MSLSGTCKSLMHLFRVKWPISPSLHYLQKVSCISLPQPLMIAYWLLESFRLCAVMHLELPVLLINLQLVCFPFAPRCSNSFAFNVSQWVCCPVFFINLNPHWPWVSLKFVCAMYLAKLELHWIRWHGIYFPACASHSCLSNAGLYWPPIFHLRSLDCGLLALRNGLGMLKLILFFPT